MVNDYAGYEEMLFWVIPTPVRREDVEEAISLLSGDAAAEGIVRALAHWIELPSSVYITLAVKEAFAADKAAKEKEKAALAAWIAADEAERVRQRTGWRGLRRRVRKTWQAARLRLLAVRYGW